jgi:hypothetical protein
MKKKLLMTTVFLTFAMLLLADGVLGDEKIVGTVSGDVEGVSVILTKIECSGESVMSTTDLEADGSYKFSDVSNGFYYVTLENTLEKKDSLSAENQSCTFCPEYTVLRIKDNAAKEVDFTATTTIPSP